MCIKKDAPSTHSSIFYRLIPVGVTGAGAYPCHFRREVGLVKYQMHKNELKMYLNSCLIFDLLKQTVLFTTVWKRLCSRTTGAAVSSRKQHAAAKTQLHQMNSGRDFLLFHLSKTTNNSGYLVSTAPPASSHLSETVTQKLALQGKQQPWLYV